LIVDEKRTYLVKKIEKQIGTVGSNPKYSESGKQKI